MLKQLQKSVSRLFNPRTKRVTLGAKILTLLLIGIIIAAAAWATVILYDVDYSPKKEGFEGQKELLLLHMEGCPHCVRLMPEWNAFTQENDTGIKTRMVERKEDPGLVSKHGVQGFPAVLLLDGRGDKFKTYDGPRTKDGLLQFCKAYNIVNSF